MAELLGAVEASAVATALRGSTWAYPLVNAGHIVGVALLFGAIAPVDLRLLGAWRNVPVAVFLRVLVPVSLAGLGLAALCGGLLFVTDARDYAASGLFRAKMAMLAVGLANAAALHALRRRHDPEIAGRPVPGRRLFAAASLAAWLSVIVLGRLIGYF